MNSPDPIPDTRPVHATLTSAEFGAVRWASQRCGREPVKLAEFFRRALLAYARKAMWRTIRAGREVPDNIHSLLTKKDHQ